MQITRSPDAVMNGRMKISKLDAVKRQLETAIKLYFIDGDPVSIHTLTAAAHNISLDMNKMRGREPLQCKELMLDLLLDEYRTRAKQMLTEAENFFKRAEINHNEVLEFNPDLSEALLLEACNVYMDQTGEEPPLFTLYLAWIVANHPDYFKLPANNPKLELRKNIQAMNKAEYFNSMLPILTTGH